MHAGAVMGEITSLRGLSMNAFLVSAGVVALAEIGDKTQILALLLAARFKRPVPILLGIAVAALLNHGIAAFAGTWIGAFLTAERIDWLIGISFLGVAAWALLPERSEREEAPRGARYGVLASTALSMFFAEMGDRTQIATVALAAQFGSFLPVVLGTALGMVFANLPAVLLGHIVAERLPLRLIRGAAAAVFAALGAWVIYGAFVRG